MRFEAVDRLVHIRYRRIGIRAEIELYGTQTRLVRLPLRRTSVFDVIELCLLDIGHLGFLCGGQQRKIPTC